MILGMAGVGFFGMLFVGFLAGWIAERVMNRDHGLLTNILVGIAGSFVGGTAASMLGFQWYGFMGNLVVASLGAIGILWFFGKREQKSPRQRKPGFDYDPGIINQADDRASTSPKDENRNLPPIYHAAPEYSEARPPVSVPRARKTAVKKASTKKPSAKKPAVKRKS